MGGEYLWQCAGIERGGAESIRWHQGKNPARTIHGDGLAVPDKLADGAHPARCVQELRGWIDLEWPYCQHQRDRLRQRTEIPQLVARDELRALGRARSKSCRLKREFLVLPGNSRYRQI